MAESSSSHVTIREIEPGTPEYAEAAELRYEALYRHLGLPRKLVEDETRDECAHAAAFSPRPLMCLANEACIA